ncbi:MAG TPA: rhodanese-like domain-containing protein [Rhodospirillales bacterium]|nr:rhodanese-like domain-containing protein [Rhodospirillales bacterium]
MALKTSIKQMVEEAESSIKTIPVAEAISLLDRDDHVFVDLRDVRELDHEGMVPDAFHAPRGMIEFWVDPESPYHKDIFASGKTFVFYCRSGWRSALSTKTVQDMGLDNVCHIGGGFGAWMEAEGPVVERPKKKKD